MTSAKPFQTSLIASPFSGEDFTLRALSLREPMPPGLFHRPAGIYEYFFVYYHQEVTVTLDGVKIVCPAGTMVIWEPGDAQEYGCPDDVWMQSYLDCAGPLIRDAIAELQLPLRVPLLCPHASHVEQYLEALAHEITDRTVPDAVIARELMIIWLREVHHLAHPDSQQRRNIPPGLVKARAYLETHYAQPITLEALADQVQMSVTHLRREFKRYFHIAPMQYLIDLRMRRAGDLLHDHHLSVAEVTARVGYQEQSYFSLAFKKYHGVTPLAWRRHAGGDQAEARRQEEVRLREFRQWLREGWVPVYEADYTESSMLDPRFQLYWHDDHPIGHATLFPAPELHKLAQGALHLLPITQGWLCMRWEEELNEEVKWEVTIDNTRQYGLNVYLSISGDLQAGYRLRIYGAGNFALETVHNGIHEVLMQQDSAIPLTPEIRISFWRSGNVFIAEINGRRALTYHDPLPPSGAPHRTCAIGHFCTTEDLIIRRLQLFTRQAPRFVDILEPGRVMLRQGHAQSALSWFENLLHTQEDASVLREARYLAAFAVPAEDHAQKECALQVVADDEENPFRVHAWRDLALLRLHRQHFAGAVEAARMIAQFAPHDLAPQRIADQFIETLRRAIPVAQRETLLALVQQLPVTRLQLHGLDLTSLEPLRGMALSELGVRANSLTDLSPLAKMPLHVLDIGHNSIENLTPLHGMPLRDIQCYINRIHDLTPLQGMPLTSLVCHHNAIEDLSPLQGMPLANLCCYSNHIATLAPLAGLPLYSLDCAYNAISDLTPLRQLPLTSLNINGNSVIDLRPISRLPLISLEIADPPFTAENMRVITGLPLERFIHTSLSPIAWTLLADLPRLQYLNQHTIAHARALGETLVHILSVWQRGTAVSPTLQPSTALRRFAHEGDGVAYLAVPLCLTRAEAEAFSAWQGGHLPMPTTPERAQALNRYLLTVTEAGWGAMYHLGVHDAMLPMPYWETTAEMEMARRTGEAFVQFSRGTNELIWRSAPRNAPTYVLIEWRHADDTISPRA